MADLWIVDGKNRITLGGKTGAKYDRTKPKKLGLHTTEGKYLKGAENAYKNYPPHIGCDPRSKTVHQYVPLNKASYSAKGRENDDEPMIQVEICGFAGQSHNWSREDLQWLVDAVFFPIWQLWPYELQGPPQGFKGEMDKEAIWARSDSPIRFSNREFEAFSGIVGHQHFPAPDNHWDPGKIDIDTICSMLRVKAEGALDSKDTAVEDEIMGLAAATAQQFKSIETRLAAFEASDRNLVSRLDRIERTVAVPVPPVRPVSSSNGSVPVDVLAGILQHNLSAYDLALSLYVTVFSASPNREDLLGWMDQIEVKPIREVAEMMIAQRG